MRQSIKTCYTRVISGTFSVRCTTLVLGLSVSLFLSACPGARKQTLNTPTAKPVLSANPNPVPAGDPDQPVASTQISWDTGDGTTGDLYVRIDREGERFVSSAPSGVIKIDWIQFDSLYEFRLYAKKRSKLLATLTVTRDD